MLRGKFKGKPLTYCAFHIFHVILLLLTMFLSNALLQINNFKLVITILLIIECKYKLRKQDSNEDLGKNFKKK